MTEEVGSEGVAADPQVEVVEHPDPGVEPAPVDQAAVRSELEAAVASASAKVEKQQEHLRGAQEALDKAQAELNAHDGGQA